MARPWQPWRTNGDTGDLQKLSCMIGFSEHPQCEQKCKLHWDFLLPVWCLVFSSSGPDDPRLVFSLHFADSCSLFLKWTKQCFQSGAFPISLKPGMFIERWNHVLLIPVRFTFMISRGSWQDHSTRFLFELRSCIWSKWDGTVAGGRVGLNEWVGILRSLFCKAGPKPEVTPPDPWCLLGNVWKMLLSGPEPRHENRGKRENKPNFIT